MFLQKETSHCKNSLAMGPKGAGQYIFGNQFYSKNAGKYRFHVFLPYHVRKHMKSSFYLKWTKFTKTMNFVANVSSREPKLNWKQIYNFF